MADEENKNKSEIKVTGEELLKKIKEIINEGNVRKIIIKDDKGNTYLEIPLIIGVAATILLPIYAAIGAIAALVSNFTIEVIRKE